MVNLALIRSFEMNLVQNLKASDRLKSPSNYMSKIDWDDKKFKDFQAAEKDAKISLNKFAQDAMVNELEFKHIAEKSSLFKPLDGFEWNTSNVLIAVLIGLFAVLFTWIILLTRQVHQVSRGRQATLLWCLPGASCKLLCNVYSIPLLRDVLCRIVPGISFEAIFCRVQRDRSIIYLYIMILNVNTFYDCVL